MQILSREAAQKVLSAEESVDWQETALSEIATILPETLRPTAYALLGRTPTGEIFMYNTNDAELYGAHTQEVERCLALLAIHTAEERVAIFAVLAPRLAVAVEATWQLLGRLPYQAGWPRRSFRIAPENPIHTAQRVQWVRTLLPLLARYREKDLVWFAAWVPYLAPYSTQPFGWLFAAAINAGGLEGEEIFTTLVASARNEHAIGRMGRHVTTALLTAERPEGWQCVEQLLLAAQHEEGLRQVILEAVDEAHPQAFHRLLSLVLAEDLLRFSSVVRAVDVWLGFERSIEDVPKLRQVLATLLTLLSDEARRDEALAQGHPEEVYLALWCSAFLDAEAAIVQARLLVLRPDLPAQRLAATHLLTRLCLPETLDTLVALLDDVDLRVALSAFSGLRAYDLQSYPALFEQLQRLLVRVDSKKRALSSGIWPWLSFSVAPDRLLQTMLNALGERDPQLLLPFLARMAESDRLELADRFAALPVWDWPEEMREALYILAGSRSEHIRERVYVLLGAYPLDAVSRQALEQLLTRKGSELRRGVIVQLLKEKDEAVLESAGRLLSQRPLLQRLAGLDMLKMLVLQQRQAAQALTLAALYREQQETLSAEEEALLASIAHVEPPGEAPTAENVLGLIDPAQRTPVLSPRSHTLTLDTLAAWNCLRALNALVEQYATTPVLIKTWQGREEMLLGNLSRRFPAPGSQSKSADDEREHLPLAEIWWQWEQARGTDLRDLDGLELVRAFLFLHRTRAVTTVREVKRGDQAFLQRLERPAAASATTPAEAPDTVPESALLDKRYAFLLESLLLWLQRHQGITSEQLDFVLATAETSCASVPVADILKQEAAKDFWSHQGFRREIAADGAIVLLRAYRSWSPDLWSAEQQVRFWHLLHWLDEPAPGLTRQRPQLDILLDAWRVGGANETDVLDHLGGPTIKWQRPCHYDLLMLSPFVPPQSLTIYPELASLVTRLRSRILEIELTRGDLATAATKLAWSLAYSGGIATAVRLMALLAHSSLKRGLSFNSHGKEATWSYLLRVSMPAASETPEEFACQVQEAHLSQASLVAVALYAPQWAHFIEYVLQWPHFADAVWWIYAHTRGTNWSVDEATRAMWQAQVAERTMISSEALLEGAVDVAWFQRSYYGLGAERWEALYNAAQYAASGNGHGRARLYADAMTGKVDASALIPRMLEKRYQDAARALGLVPLPQNAQEREAEIAARYQVFQEFKRTGKKFGSQRRGNEEIAVRIGMANLARAAGFSEPLRLQWSMEARATTDLRSGPLTVNVDNVQITLALDAHSTEPVLTILGNKGRLLRTLPTRLKKHQDVQALLARKLEIEQQILRMRISFEEALCRGDQFTASELLALLAHPVLARLLQALIFVQPAHPQRPQELLLGYPLLESKGEETRLFLLDATGQRRPVETASTDLRLAHPYDLFLAQNWHSWQHECFSTARAQPFKQIFRELYVFTASEVREGDEALSRRYAGQQVQPAQARALLGKRGWIVSYEGEVSRTFHADGLTAHVTFSQNVFTPAEMEDLALDAVFFAAQGEYRPVPLAQVPPRIFSETMRDLDLVVSVAYSGGVDPEATASTLEMRSALVSETCALLGLENVTLKSAHVLIEGRLGRYTLHLGSGVVHRQPGGALCIVPVHAQHRGRIFLPFADNDPKTAEVITRVITLAQDHLIKDPTILEQLL